MKGMGQIVSWSVRDESLHCEGITRLFHAFVKERDCLTRSVRDDILDCCHKTVRLEDAFIDLAFEHGPVPGMTAKEIKKYIRYIARSEEHTSELQSLMRISYAVFCLKKKTTHTN